jgi:hypothetical protein
MKAAATLMTVLVLAEDAPKAPEPAKPVDAASFYAGRWYEIGRTPKSFNAGCVAGFTDYQTKGGALSERDGCHDKTPDGKEEVLDGQMKVLNPGANSKIPSCTSAPLAICGGVRRTSSSPNEEAVYPRSALPSLRCPPASSPRTVFWSARRAWSPCLVGTMLLIPFVAGRRRWRRALMHISRRAKAP